MIIHRDRVPALPRGRHASRIQRTNHRRRTRWHKLKNDVRNWENATGKYINEPRQQGD